MRDDVRIAASCDDSWDHCESSDSDDDRRGRDRKKERRGLGSSDDPTLFVEGDATFGGDFNVEGDLTVEAEDSTVTLQGELAVNDNVIVRTGDLIVREGSIAYQRDLIECPDLDPLCNI